MKEWKDEKKGVKSKHKETAMKQRSAMMKRMVPDDEEEEDSEEEMIDDSTVSSSSSEVGTQLQHLGRRRRHSRCHQPEIQQRIKSKRSIWQCLRS